MKILNRNSPRVFSASGISIFDCASVKLESDEQITLVSEINHEFDIVKKNWGYYATPSLNSRLPSNGLRPVLVVNHSLKYYILLVEKGREILFQSYLKDQSMTVVCWLDDMRTLEKISDLSKSLQIKND